MTERIPQINEHWHWKCEPANVLAYVGKAGPWHQFEQVGKPGVVWCEVLTPDLRMLEPTEKAP